MFKLAENFSVETSARYVDLMREMFESEGIGIEQVRKAALMMLKTKKDSFGKMPSFAEYLEYIKPDKEKQAEIEVQNVIKLIRSEGVYYEPDLKPEIKRIIDSRFGGWKQICGSLEESKIQWFIRDFKEAYLSQETETLMLPDKEESGRVLKQIGVAGGAEYKNAQSGLNEIRKKQIKRLK